MSGPDSEDSSGTAPGGRHSGSSGGLTAAELIARSRAARAAGESQPQSRSARRAAAEAAEAAIPPENDPVPPVEGVAENVTAEIPVLEDVPILRHLSLVDPPIAMVDEPELLPPKARGGRNLPAAIAVGLGLGVLILATLLLYRPSFVVLLTVAAVVGGFEMVGAVSTVEARPSLVPLLVGGVAMDVAAWFRGPDGLVGVLMLTVIGLIVWRLADGAAGYLRDVAAGTLVALYVPFLAGFAALLAHPHDGAARVVMFILAVVCSDTGGYAVGAVIGRHPMAPTVSPKKSWEGFVGSIAASAGCGVLMMIFTFHHEWWKGVAYGVAIAFTATLGDLGESMIKRDLGLKDMGKLLPGHGGIMDRLDSLLPCAAVAYLLLSAFVPV